jgi:Protein of unknown function (DUF1588)/Protein of unknown function (DUF1592)/Protein of unknown function (DUF1585)/Planctomycete cytochrome C
MNIRSAYPPISPGCVVALLISLCTAVSARPWTSADGSKTFSGELVSYDAAAGLVKVATAGGVKTFSQSVLSAADIEFVKAQAAVAPAADAAGLVVPKDLEILLEDNCYECHEDGTEKGDVRLDNLTDLPLSARLDLLNRVQEQVYLKQMPPPKKSQPSAEERGQLVAWLSKELHTHNASKLEEKLRYPNYGNFVDHGKLFSGEVKDAPFSPARRWLTSPQIFEQRVLDIFGLEGKERNQQLYGVTNPFLLTDGSGVRDYDTGLLDGGHLLVMLSNAEWISSKQIRPARVKAGEVGASDFSDPKDKWSPRATPPAFEAIILKKSPPTDAEMTDAIREQYVRVLRREPASAELAKYLELTRSFIEIGGNTEGLRQMLTAVLLDSEFLYRLEFGDGAVDSHGRKMLSPREATYAISYALGDRGPDAKLLEAAAGGKLRSREDYHREVTRLLADNDYYRGSVDPAFTTGKVLSHITSHPKINRFFREFFGYPNATKVFKDKERSEGYYQNPDRGTLATPGFLVNEADRLVDHILQGDKDVFAKLLTTDEFFVYHNRSNEEGTNIIKEWREVYEALKNTDWKTDPQGVLDKHGDIFKGRKSTYPMDATRPGELVNYMHFFEEYFGKGRTPFTTIPWAHGYTFHHSPFYSLPPTPSIGRYGSWKDKKYNGKLPEMELWDYPVVQPFKIENRMGILTHPAWLIAHSHNTQNDPVVRGRWVREKLLAGRVPDVPITVDAVIPEDHEKTLRTRLDLKTQEPECWKCHVYMNPLGLPFESFDDFGRYRMEEFLEAPENIIGKTPDNRFNVYKTLPVDSTGLLDGTGDPALDGEVKDAFDLIGRIAKSDRSRQSIIRYAFRFYMGRNEMFSDSKTLIDADKAYLESGGSFRAVIVSLLTSDSFMYRKDPAETLAFTR